MSRAAVILAAGKGTRMGSELPKVLHLLHAQPLIHYPVRAAFAAGADPVVVVVGHGAAEVEAAVGSQYPAVQFVVQPQQLGTGHAVACALPALAAVDGMVWILSGDVPRLRAASLIALADACAASSAGLAVATFTPDPPQGYGRIVRNADGAVRAIVEERDATPAQRALGECNAGVYCVAAAVLRATLPRLGTGNAQGEMYLTDIVALAAASGQVLAVPVPGDEVAGVNTREQLAALAALGPPRL